MTRAKVRFYTEEVRRAIRSGGEAIKALEILERELCAALSSPCEEPIDTDYEAVLWHDYDDLYHLDTNLSKHLPSLLPRQKVKVRVIILAEPQGEEKA